MADSQYLVVGMHGQPIRLTLGMDVTDATEIIYHFIKPPNDECVDKKLSDDEITIVDAVTGVTQYKIEPDLLDIQGTWRIVAEVVTVDGDVIRFRPYAFTVDPFACGA